MTVSSWAHPASLKDAPRVRLPVGPASVALVKLRRISPEDDGWFDLLSRREDAGPLHHPSWLSVLRESYGFSVCVIACVSEEGVVSGGLPLADVAFPLRGRRWISLPFTDYCPPLLPARAELPDLAAGLDSLRRAANVRSLELRDELGNQRRTSFPAGVRHVLLLDQEPSAIFASLKSSTRRNIRAALRNGVRVVRREGQSDVTETFYRLQSVTRRRLGVPVQPRKYFEALWRNMIARKLGFLLLAYFQDRPIAGAIFLEWKTTVVYKHGASDHSFWSLRPNDLLFWKAIESSAGRGAHIMDFGRSAFEDQGLRRFKNGWGACEHDLVYTMIPPRAAAGRASRAPQLLAPAIRRGPIWFTRVLGTAFYRYAA
jgi:CelD/BcsL family acetyltransferase involved in cellulose biosynthesis